MALPLILLPFGSYFIGYTCAVQTVPFRNPSTAAFDALLTAGVVVDASNGFQWPEDVACVTRLLSTMLGDTANLQIVALLPGACSLSDSLWTIETPPCMSRWASFTCPALPCPLQPCPDPALPHPALLRPAPPSPALLCPVLPCPALPALTLQLWPFNATRVALVSYLHDRHPKSQSAKATLAVLAKS